MAVKKAYIFSVCLYVFAFVSFNVFSDVKVSAKIDSENCVLGKSYSFKIEIEGFKSVTTPEIHGNEAWDITYIGPMIEVKSIAGSFTRKKVFMYSIVFKKKGKITIPAIDVNVDGKIYHTNPVVVNVSENPNIEEKEDSISCVFEFDQKRIYVGQPVLLKIKFKIKDLMDIMNLSINLPKMENFVKYDMDGGSSNFNRIGSDVFEKNVILVPIKTGKQKIGPFKISYYVRERRQRHRVGFDDGFFDDDFFRGFFDETTYVPKTLSKYAQIDVLPLPEEGKPHNFSGTVGSYEMKVEAPSKKEYSIGEPINIKVSIVGVGDVYMIKEPFFEDVEGFKTFPAESSVKVDNLRKVLRGKKTFTKVFLPERQGELKLPDIVFNYFDPILKEYKILKWNGFRINVKGNEKSNENFVLLNKNEKKGSSIKYKGFDIVSVKDVLGKNRGKLIKLPNWLYYFLFGMVLLFLVVFEYGYNFYSYIRIKYEKSRYTPYKLFIEKIREIESKVEDYKDSDLAKNLEESILVYLNKKFGVKSKVLFVDDMVDKIKQKGVRDDVIASLKNIFSELDSMKYGLGIVSGEKKKKFLEMVKDTIKAVEDSLKNERV